MAERKMRKIKGLKVPLRYYEIERKLRKSVVLPKENENDLDNFLKQTVSSIISSFQISLIYDTFDITKDDFFKSFVNRKKTNYISCGFFTFGYNLNRDSFQDDLEKNIFDIVIDVQSKTSFEIIKDVIKEEAKKERLSVEEIITIYEPGSVKEPQILEKIVNLINLDNNLIEYKDGKIYPIYSWSFLVPWVSSKK